MGDNEDQYRCVVSNQCDTSTDTSAAATLTVTCPTITVGELPDGVLGTPYAQTNTASGGGAPYTFATNGTGSLPPGLSYASDGSLTGTPTTLGAFTFTVVATDTNNCTGSSNYTVTVTCPAITIDQATLPAGTIGVPYNQTNTASGGTTNYTYAVSGTLPLGLSYDNGVLSGTPTNTTSGIFTVTATDTDNCQGSQTYTVAVNCATITFSPSSLTNATRKVAYSNPITASGGLAPYTYAASGLPAGMSITTNGLLNGKPTVYGLYNITVTVTDAANCTAEKVYPLSVSVAGGDTIGPVTVIMSPKAGQLRAHLHLGDGDGQGD